MLIFLWSGLELFSLPLCRLIGFVGTILTDMTLLFDKICEKNHSFFVKNILISNGSWKNSTFVKIWLLVNLRKFLEIKKTFLSEQTYY